LSHQVSADDQNAEERSCQAVINLLHALSPHSWSTCVLSCSVVTSEAALKDNAIRQLVFKDSE